MYYDIPFIEIESFFDKSYLQGETTIVENKGTQSFFDIPLPLKITPSTTTTTTKNQCPQCEPNPIIPKNESEPQIKPDLWFSQMYLKRKT